MWWTRWARLGKAVKSQGDGQGITSGFSCRIRTNVKDHYLVSREKVKLNANRFTLRTSVKGLEIGKNPTEVPWPNLEWPNLERLNVERPNLEWPNFEWLNLEKDRTSNDRNSKVTEPRMNEPRKGPNLKWPNLVSDRTSNDLTSNGTEPRKCINKSLMYF